MQAIETLYNGYRFRSRLEARWAVFFDALGVKYEYEPEGFKLDDGKLYLPDFRVKCWGLRGEIWNEPFDLYIEVKGKMTEYDAKRIKRFAISRTTEKAENGSLRIASEFAHPTLIVGNIPDAFCSHDSSANGAYDGMDGTDIYPFNYSLIDGDYFGAYPAACEGKFFLWGDDFNYIWNVEKVEEAYNMARQARFEHGECG